MTNDTTTTETTTDQEPTRRETKVSYTLPWFDDWQSNQERRISLRVDVFVDTFAVGRAVHLAGRVSFRTIPGRSDLEGWHIDDTYLYRVDARGSSFGGDVIGRPPTDAMVKTVRDAALSMLEEPSDHLRMVTARRMVEQRNRSARETFDRENKETATFLTRFEDALGVDLGSIAKV